MDMSTIAAEIIDQLGDAHTHWYDTQVDGVPTLVVSANYFGKHLSIEQDGRGRRISINGKVASEATFRKTARNWQQMTENFRAASADRIGVS